MAPRFTSFKSVWNKVMVNNDIENTVSPEKPVAPKRNPLSLSTSNSALSNSNSASGTKSLFKKSSARISNEVPEDGSTGQEEREWLNNVPTIYSSCDEQGTGPGSNRSGTPASNVASSRSIKTPIASKGDSHQSVWKDDTLQTSKPTYDSTVATVQVESATEKRLIDPVDEADDLEAGLFRVLIFTDTHLGYKESDPIRANDAFNAFEEALFLAKHLRVDAIFHAGDLFDESHPSRNVMYRTMELLSKYCRVGEGNGSASKAIEVEVQNNSTQRSNDEKRKMLFKSLNVRVSNERRLPFFIIHGNHDNPSGLNDLSPIDLLDVANLVTYFGSVSDFNHIELRPILLNKEGIRVALYGIGWVKDESLYMAFQDNRVTFVPPSDEYQWFKVLLFHQNRYARHGKSSRDYILEEFLPDWLDLVIWGHEHECLKVPQHSMNRNFQVLQLGSSVQTSLAAAEMAPKHCCLMEINMEQVNFYPITLETARQLHYSDVSLKQLGLKQEATEKEISEKLTTMVEKILSGMKKREKTALRAGELAKIVVPSNNKFKLHSAIKDAEALPLIRLRIEHTGFQSTNPRTFGNTFKGRVANPFDILRFWQKRQPRPGRTEVIPAGSTPEAAQAGRQNVKDAVFSEIEENCRLKVLLEHDLNAAVQRYAVGLETQAICDYVRKCVEDMHGALINDMAPHSSDQLCEDVYHQLIERSILAKSQAARAAAGMQRSPTNNGNANSVGLDDLTKYQVKSNDSIGIGSSVDLGSSMMGVKSSMIEWMVHSNRSTTVIAADPITCLSGGDKGNASSLPNPSTKRLLPTITVETDLSKRTCTQVVTADANTPSPFAEHRNPLESLSLLTGRETYENIKPYLSDEKPLKLSDFDEEPLPNATVDATTRLAENISLKHLVGDRPSTSQLSERLTYHLNGKGSGESHTQTEKRTSTRSSTHHSQPGRQQSSNQEDSSQCMSQKPCSQGFKNTLISMFFRKK